MSYKLHSSFFHSHDIPFVTLYHNHCRMKLWSSTKHNMNIKIVLNRANVWELTRWILIILNGPNVWPVKTKYQWSQFLKSKIDSINIFVKQIIPLTPFLKQNILNFSNFPTFLNWYFNNSKYLSFCPNKHSSQIYFCFPCYQYYPHCLLEKMSKIQFMILS